MHLNPKLKPRNPKPFFPFRDHPDAVPADLQIFDLFHGYIAKISKDPSISLATMLALQVIFHASRVTRHTSHVTRHTSHVTRHTSHVTRHTSQPRAFISLSHRWRCSTSLCPWLPTVSTRSLPLPIAHNLRPLTLCRPTTSWVCVPRSSVTELRATSNPRSPTRAPSRSQTLYCASYTRALAARVVILDPLAGCGGPAPDTPHRMVQRAVHPRACALPQVPPHRNCFSVQSPNARCRSLLAFLPLSHRKKVSLSIVDSITKAHPSPYPKP
jgi:hypothetical protein